MFKKDPVQLINIIWNEYQNTLAYTEWRTNFLLVQGFLLTILLR